MTAQQKEGFDEMMMRRALQLALNGAGDVSPNPMVGAVIVAPGGRIIGEGWHRRYGGAHAEVNAVRSVAAADEPLLPQSTIYVTLEPCSHHGKTPPCSLLLREKGFRRVAVGMVDPNPKVAGRGIRMLREAGAEVTTGILETECRRLNVRFITAQTLRRPWIQLKWAESADGYIAGHRGEERAIFSSPLSMTLMHKERAMTDAILVGTDTLLTDNPSLTTRLWPGRDPVPVLFRSERWDESDTGIRLLSRNPIILDPGTPLADNMHLLMECHGLTSLMVEGGSRILQSFVDSGLYDEIRIERSPAPLHAGTPAPHIAERTRHDAYSHAQGGARGGIKKT